MASSANRFPIRFDTFSRVLFTVLLLSPSRSYVEILGNQVIVRMAWGFCASFPRLAVVAATKLDKRPISRGVHGSGGRWLVNGSGDGIVTIDLEPRPRAYVMGFPVRLRQLMVSVEEPEKLIATLKAQP